MNAPVNPIHLPRFALRSADLGRRLDIFLVCAVGSVLGNRVFLIATAIINAPQIACEMCSVPLPSCG